MDEFQDSMNINIEVCDEYQKHIVFVKPLFFAQQCPMQEHKLFAVSNEEKKSKQV